ncbi:RNA polymerase sigma factor [Roseimaritima multifibrata]|nr:RNA polymerase sigma factor [Roseimaritima multifibrata]
MDDESSFDLIDDPTVLAGAVGDRRALREIYEATSDRVFGLMVRMVGIQDAEDLTQHVFVHAFSKLHQFSGEAKFETWLYRLATNEALQYLRREKRRRTSELVVEPTTQQPDLVVQEERASQVHQALAALDPELRAIFILKEENQLSYQEIAATLKIPEGTVGSRLNRARRELKRLLGDAETGRQGDRETGRQGDRETGRQGDRETGRQGVKGVKE